MKHADDEIAKDERQLIVERVDDDGLAVADQEDRPEHGLKGQRYA